MAPARNADLAASRAPKTHVGERRAVSYAAKNCQRRWHASSEMQQQLPSLKVAAAKRYNLDLQDWFELRAMLTTAAAIVTVARWRAPRAAARTSAKIFPRRTMHF